MKLKTKDVKMTIALKQTTHSQIVAISFNLVLSQGCAVMVGNELLYYICKTPKKLETISPIDFLIHFNITFQVA